MEKIECCRIMVNYLKDATVILDDRDVSKEIYIMGCPIHYCPFCGKKLQDERKKKNV